MGKSQLVDALYFNMIFWDNIVAVTIFEMDLYVESQVILHQNSHFTSPVMPDIIPTFTAFMTNAYHSIMPV